MKIENLNDLKTWVNGLSEKELEKPLIYNSDTYSLSGQIVEITKATENLYYTGEDDPSTLYTKKQLKEQGFDSEDISEMDIEIHKDSYYLSF